MCFYCGPQKNHETGPLGAPFRQMRDKNLPADLMYCVMYCFPACFFITRQKQSQPIWQNQHSSASLRSGEVICQLSPLGIKRLQGQTFLSDMAIFGEVASFPLLIPFCISDSELCTGKCSVAQALCLLLQVYHIVENKFTSVHFIKLSLRTSSRFLKCKINCIVSTWHT